MAAFEQGPESADAPPKEVAPSGAEGMSFMQTSELAHVEQHANVQSSENAYVKEGEAQDGPGVGMTRAPGAEDEPVNAAAPSLAQLDAQTVSGIAMREVQAAHDLLQQLSGQQPGSFNWADAEDSHHVPETSDMPSATEAPLASAPVPAAPEGWASAPADLAPPITTDITNNVQPAQPNREGARGRGARGGQRGNFRGAPRPRGRGPPNGNGANGPQASQNKENDDGFIAVRRRPAQGQGQGQGQSSFRGRGRGNAGNVSGEGARGRGSFRGRGANAGGARKTIFERSFYDPLTSCS
jgi:hypothetical protein